jgi:hypothetical protein
VRERTLTACRTAQTDVLRGRKMASDREANVVFTVGNEVHSTKTHIRKEVISMRKQLLNSLVAVSTVVLFITQTAPRIRF